MRDQSLSKLMIAKLWTEARDHAEDKRSADRSCESKATRDRAATHAARLSVLMSPVPTCT